MKKLQLSYWAEVGVALAGLPLATVAATWLIGDQSYSGPVEGGLDHLLQPWPVPEGVITVAGICASLALAASAVLLARRRPARRILLNAALAGATIAWIYRSCTAGVVGANIGAGLTLIFTIPMAAALLLAAVWVAIRERPAREERTRQRG